MGAGQKGQRAPRLTIDGGIRRRIQRKIVREDFVAVLRTRAARVHEKRRRRDLRHRPRTGKAGRRRNRRPSASRARCGRARHHRVGDSGPRGGYAASRRPTCRGSRTRRCSTASLKSTARRSSGTPVNPTTRRYLGTSKTSCAGIFGAATSRGASSTFAARDASTTCSLPSNVLSARHLALRPGAKIRLHRGERGA